MIKGILNNQEVLAQRQIDKAFADTLQTEVDKAIDLNNEQEALKARLKEKTEQLDATMSALTKKTGEARKIIKLDMPQSSWREFGIGDKR
jgi:tRNA A-37 threonylcarbamoyl transferase component Bud32